MSTLADTLNNALITRKANVGGIVPLASYLGFFSEGRNAPILQLEALFLNSNDEKYRFSYSAQKSTIPEFSYTLLLDYRKPEKLELVLEDENGIPLLSTENHGVCGIVYFQVQNSLNHSKHIMSCFAAVSPNHNGIWLASPNDILKNMGMIFLKQLEDTVQQAMPETPSTSYWATSRENGPNETEEYYDEESF